MRIMFESNKIILTKNDVFVGKGYYNHDIFMLNIYEIIINDNAFSFAYLIDSFDI